MGKEFLAYVEKFDVVPQINKKVSKSSRRGCYPESATSLFILKRAQELRHSGELSSKGMASGDGIVIPISQLRAPAELVPRFGSEADRRLTRTNSRVYSTEFWLDKYLDKEIYYALTLNNL